MAQTTRKKGGMQSAPKYGTDQRNENETETRMPLGRKNYLFMLIGVGIIILGFVLMSGGGSSDPNEFDYSMFSFRRITLAPVVVLAGFAFELFAIMKRFKK